MMGRLLFLFGGRKMCGIIVGADMESAPTATGYGLPCGIRRGAFYILPRASAARPYNRAGCSIKDMII